MKYTTYDIVFREIPNEVTLAINLSNCPFRCKGCHSPELQENLGNLLTAEKVVELIAQNLGITCVCFMGGDQNLAELKELSRVVSEHAIKRAWYSGRSELPKEMLAHFEYIKVGPYVKERGPLDSETTNQRLYRIKTESPSSYLAEDITALLQQKGF